MLFAGNGLATATGQLGCAEHAIAIEVACIECIPHPRLVLGWADAAVAIRVHAQQVIAGSVDLGVCGNRDQQSKRKQEGLEARHAVIVGRCMPNGMNALPA